MKNKRVFEFLKIYKDSIIYLLILNVFLIIPTIIAPIFKMVFTNNILMDGKMEWLPALLSAMVVMATFSGAITWMKTKCVLRLENSIEISGVSKYFWRLINSPCSAFDKKESAVLMTELNRSDRLAGIVSEELIEIAFCIVSIAFNLFMMFQVDLLLGGISLMFIAIYMMITQYSGFFISKVKNKINKKSNVEPLSEKNLYDIRTNIYFSGLQDMETFKSTASETFFFQRILNNNIAILNSRKDSDYEDALSPLEDVSSILFINTILLISALRIMDKGFTIGQFLAFQAYAVAFFYPLSYLLSQKHFIKDFEKKLKKRELQNKEQETKEHVEMPSNFQKLHGYIEFKDVSFGYSADKLIVKNFNLSVKPGQRVAILGIPGSGKTTLIKLLQGLYTPTAGQVTIDGYPCHTIDKNLFANSVGCANQELSFFSATIRENITLWDDSVPEADVYFAATDACIHDYIAGLNGAYDYKIDENGRNLSGGQRQRIEIARALLNNPSIVIFDEATSSLDTINIEKIGQNLIRRSCTCIEVTHALHNLKGYDTIIVMEDGEITQKGTYEELIKSRGLYAYLSRSEIVQSEILREQLLNEERLKLEMAVEL